MAGGKMYFEIIIVGLNFAAIFVNGYTPPELPFPIWNSRGASGNPEDLKDLNCGTYPINVNNSYRIQTVLQHFQIFYPTINGLDCVWRFYGQGCYPTISCSVFDIAESSECSNAHLEITDEYLASKRFCGNRGPENTTTGTTILTAKFPRTLSIPKRGFTCLVTCSATLDGLDVLNKTLAVPSTANCSCGTPGTSNPSDVRSTTHRIVGGKDALPNYWKWQVALVPKTRNAPFCGGALINDRFVLSAAHCVVHTGLVAIPAAADIILNAYNLKNSSELTLRRGVIGIHPHPFYDPVGQDYDISLIEFSDPVNLMAPGEPSVHPVCIPPSGMRDLFVEKMGTVTGWGVIAEGGKQAMILKEAEVPIMANADCAAQYKVGDKPISITDRMLCAGYDRGGIDACQGDSGGPFVLKNEKGRYMQVGVVSFGEGCARAGKPGVYARVTEVSDWIRSIAKRGTWCID